MEFEIYKLPCGETITFSEAILPKLNNIYHDGIYNAEFVVHILGN